MVRKTDTEIAINQIQHKFQALWRRNAISQAAMGQMQSALDLLRNKVK